MNVRSGLLPMLSFLTVGLSGCSFAPDYSPPVVETPAKFKENKSWAEARPRDDQSRGPWWRALSDRTLNEIEGQIDTGSQSLAASVALLDQSRAFAAKAEAGLMPTIDFSNSYSSNKQSAHRPLRNSNRVASPQGLEQALIDGRPFDQPSHYGNNMLSLQSSYEVDLWGRVRNSIASREAQAQASAADLETIRLSLQAEVARDYVALRTVDSEIALYDHVVASYALALDLTKTLVKGNVGAPSDEPRAMAQLEIARARRAELEAKRAMYEHAIATLVGRAASSFSIRPSSRSNAQPTIPSAVPLTLLERRPDVAAAERRVAAANATIGVARAAFFPRLTINLSGGTQDTGLSLLNFKNSVWSVGPAITLPIFDGEARVAELDASKASHAHAVAEYRETVLRAFQEVEDNLSNLRWLAKQERSIGAAVASTQKVLDISLVLYRDGATNYLDVITAQTAALDARDALLSLKGKRLQAAIALMLSLGGGWSSADLRHFDNPRTAALSSNERTGGEP
ncbi:MAG TPA: efflux transporter outer membrane subunit [Methylosinus sp.]|jgi:NodT family efflux transporter outer membrane factor (OMF) lipoprotein|uniref:efflux transporter outer membrane subunit n=1 Tax=Methylosinus sp. TaxID=427 RepID=UPI002F948445